MNKTDRMDWTKSQYLIALLIYKIAKEKLKRNFPEGKYSSLIRKLNNYRYVDTKGQEGQPGNYETNKAFFEEYKNSKIEELEADIKRVIRKEKAQNIINYRSDKR